MTEPYWCSSAPNIPRVWSASSIACFADCPRRFELRYVEGWTGRGENLDFIFGSAFHKGMFVLVRELAQGNSEADSLDAAVLAAWQYDLPKPVRPKQAGKTKLGLAKALTAYIDDYPDPSPHVLHLDKGPALEVSFRFLLPLVSPDGEPYAMRGYIDMIRTFAGTYTCVDYKSTASSLTDYYFQKYEINVQNYIYSAAARILTGLDITQFLIDAVAISPAGDIELGRRPISLTAGEVEEGLVDVQEQIRYAEHCASRNYWPKNTSACTFCDFQNVCNKDPKTRIDVLRSDFKENRRTVVEEMEVT